eukprot:TRINITY_DN7098_c0_g2_i1.p1 TRINITY_DN7098_c0_g2~~TRINITY_DN7098_c0_g2_i1.p1  ORF type:complete len:250 (-),score=55.69 TRINITY_DN7098_c0_g2_i1:192-941(-)
MDFENLVFAIDVDRTNDMNNTISPANLTELELQQRTNSQTRILRSRRPTNPISIPVIATEIVDANLSTAPPSSVNTPSPSSSASSSSTPSSSSVAASASADAETKVAIVAKPNKDKRLTLPSSPAGIDITDFECALCMQVYHQPVTTSCGHVFCRQCIVRASKHCPNCPLCRHSLESKFAVNVVLMNVVEKYFPKEHQERVCESGDSDAPPRTLNKASDELQEEVQNTWGCLIPSLRSTCTVFLSCGGF